MDRRWSLCRPCYYPGQQLASIQLGQAIEFVEIRITGTDGLVFPERKRMQFHSNLRGKLSSQALVYFVQRQVSDAHGHSPLKKLESGATGDHRHSTQETAIAA
jgi:hypothetical protein